MSKVTFDIDLDEVELENQYAISATVTVDAYYSTEDDSSRAGWEIDIKKIDVFYAEVYNADIDNMIMIDINEYPKLKKLLEDYVMDWMEEDFDRWSYYLE